MDVVYPLRPSPSGDVEIRYSLRSLALYGPKVDRVFILGTRPDWCSDDVVEVPGVDNLGDKQVNVNTKLLALCESSDVSDRFMLMNDDFFFLKPTPTIEPYTQGDLPALCKKYPTSAYGTRLRNAVAWLRARHLPLTNYEVHYPIELERRDLAPILRSIAKVPTTFRSLYGNACGMGSEPIRRDFKAFGLADLGALEGGHFLSLDDRSAGSDRIRRFLDQRFRRPSRWELTPAQANARRAQLAAAAAD